MWEILSDGILFTDENGIILYANQNVSTLSGYPSSLLIGEPVESLVPPADRKLHAALRAHVVKDPAPQSVVTWRDLTLLRRDGSELRVDIAIAPLPMEGTTWVVVAVGENLEGRETEDDHLEAQRRVREMELAVTEFIAENEQRFRAAFEDNMAPMVIADHDDRLITANAAFCQMIGFSMDELVGRDSAHFTLPEDRGITEASRRGALNDDLDQVRYTKRYQRKDGRVVVSEVSRSSIRDAEGVVVYFVFSERDVTEERALHEELAHLALHDQLTGLANRTLFEDRLSRAQARIRREGTMGAIMLFDLDGFKGFKEAYGHLAGDQLLVDFARRLKEVSRSTDTLCRLGGDEFLCLIDGLNSAIEAEDLAIRFLNVLNHPISVDGVELQQRVNVGVVVWDASSESIGSHDLVRTADEALSEARKNRSADRHHVVFTPSMHVESESRYAIAQDLRRSLGRDEIEMHFQPIVDLRGYEIVGFEALMRWRHPTQGMVPPKLFIPVAEENDLILRLGAFALGEAVSQASSWEGESEWSGRPFVTVNFSAHQFLDPGLIATIEAALEESGLSPDRLVVEITESVTLQDVAVTLDVIRRLNQLGVGFALDDFGTGFSSLSYLVQLDPQLIKVDQSFLNPPQDSERHSQLLEMIINLGHRLDVTMLAEGVENARQFEHLRTLDCDLGQGYLFSPAVPAAEVATLLRQFRETARVKGMPLQPRFLE